MAAEGQESCILGTELPLKRAREEEELNNGAGMADSVDKNGADKQQGYISSVIPGWFSEISPMWPGLSPLPSDFFFFLGFCFCFSPNPPFCVFLRWISFRLLGDLMMNGSFVIL